MNNLSLIILTIAIALVFDVINGFHDAANSIATVVATRVLKPLTAVGWAAFFNLFAMFVFGPHVAETVSSIIKVVPSESVFLWILLSGLLGAIVWDLLTWWLGLPTSSSHALIGGLVGAALAFGGPQVIQLEPVILIALFIFISPLIGFLLGSILIVGLYWLNRKERPGVVDRRFRHGQILSAALYSIGHGANDAQKTMGIILAVLIAGGLIAPNTELSLYHTDTLWIILSCHLAMAIGTFMGGWRIVRTMGMRLTKIRPIGGFAAETAGAFTLFMATMLGIPVSTTHTITGAINGVGTSTTSLTHVKWAIAARIVWAWILTLPGSAILAALGFYLFKLLLL
jgi:PiT family inorganic phosphate transporter